MATYTTHYNLKKPALADKIRIADFNGNADTIDSQMYDNASLGAQLKADIGIVENTNTASHNISEGQYVIWKGSLYVASSAISSGATLSNANLTAVSNGGLNALNSKLTTKIGNFLEIGSSYTSSISATTLRCTRRDDGLCIVDGTFTVSTAISSTARTAMFTGLPEVKNNISWATATNLTDGKTYRLSIGTTTLDEFYTAYPTGEYVVSPFMYYS